MAMYRGDRIIENEAAYEAAIRARIAANRVKGGWQRFCDANADAKELRDFAMAQGYGKTEGFFAACVKGFEEFGAPTEKMVAALRKIMSENDARKAAWKARDAASVHVSTIGARHDFTLRIAFKTSYESDFGTVHVTGFRDENENVLIYKGSVYFSENKGDTVTFKATVKAHTERDGIKQTILSRPKR